MGLEGRKGNYNIGINSEYVISSSGQNPEVNHSTTKSLAAERNIIKSWWAQKDCFTCNSFR